MSHQGKEGTAGVCQVGLKKKYLKNALINFLFIAKSVCAMSWNSCKIHHPKTTEKFRVKKDQFFVPHTKLYQWLCSQATHSFFCVPCISAYDHSASFIQPEMDSVLSAQHQGQITGCIWFMCLLKREVPAAPLFIPKSDLFHKLRGYYYALRTHHSLWHLMDGRKAKDQVC